jgi:NAD(P)-dependent dehydrogenase (short-subunit alcohol dehydrogenase family)
MSKVWFITGSSRGIGLAITTAALRAGHSVVATARNPSASPQLASLIAQHPSSLIAPAVDVSDESQVRAAVDAGLARFGRIDVVVNNAGYANLGAFEDVSAADFKAQVDANFMGVVYVTRATLPVLRRQGGGGHIFQISSVGSRVSAPGLSAYQSAKWAVSGFSVALALEVAPLGVRVTVVEPGAVRTDWAGSSMEIPAVSEPYRQTVGKKAEMTRQMDGRQPSLPDKVAGIILDVEGREDAPVRLLVGTDAVEHARAAAKALAVSDEKWEAVSRASV